ncbi:hypothetical protein ISCU110981_20275 [Isoptericola cucumis]
MLEKTKIENVLTSDFQNTGWASTAEKFSSPTNSPCPPSRFHSCSETNAVYPSGNSPVRANSRKNGEMYR